MTQKCFKCKTSENLREVPRKYKTKIYIYYICRDCNSKAAKTHYLKYKNLVFDHYGRKCKCCGEDTEIFLTIDHVNNDGYLETRNNGSRIAGGQLYRKIVSSGYPEDYQIFCMNCNFGKHMNNGVCPHSVYKVV